MQQQPQLQQGQPVPQQQIPGQQIPGQPIPGQQQPTQLQQQRPGFPQQQQPGMPGQQPQVSSQPMSTSGPGIPSSITSMSMPDQQSILSSQSFPAQTSQSQTIPTSSQYSSLQQQAISSSSVVAPVVSGQTSSVLAGQMLDKQNFIETLQQQAQPTVIHDPMRLPLTTTTIQPTPSGPSFQQQSQMPNGQLTMGLQQQQQYPPSSLGLAVDQMKMPPVSFPSTSLPSQQPSMSVLSSQSMIPGVQSTLNTDYSGMTAISSAAATSSGMFPSITSVSTASASSMTPHFKPMAGMVPTPLVMASQPIMATRPSLPMDLQQQQQFSAMIPGMHPRRMFHQQSWSEGKFDAALSQAGLLASQQDHSDTSLSSHQYQLNRRRSMEQITGLPEDYGVNTVLEPLELKLPFAVSSSNDQARETVVQQQESPELDLKQTPLREYSMLTQEPVIPALEPSSSCNVPSSSSEPLPPSSHVTTQVLDSSEQSVDSVRASEPVVTESSLETSIKSPPYVFKTLIPETSEIIEPKPTSNEIAPDDVEPIIPSTEPSTESVVVETQVKLSPEKPVVSPPSICPVVESLVDEPQVKLSPDKPVMSPPSICPVVESPVVVVRETFVNPFSILLKSFDDDSEDIPPVVLESKEPPVNVKPSEPVKSSKSVSPRRRPARDEKKVQQESLIKTETDDASSGTVSQIKDSFLLSPRRGSGDRRASLGAVGSNGSKQRSGALLPSIPNKTLEGVKDNDRQVIRTGSLSEQEFIEQLKASQINPSSLREHDSPHKKPPPIIAESMSYEIDEDYEREGEYMEEEDEYEDDDPNAIVEDASPGDVYTIPEESEEDLISPRTAEVPVVVTTSSGVPTSVQQQVQEPQRQQLPQKETPRGQSSH